MALIVTKVDFKNTEADQASTNRDLAGRPQPGDPLFQNGTITIAEHVRGEASSGIPAATLNNLDNRYVWLYDSYANAIAFATAGLVDATADVETVDRLTGLATGTNPVAQTAPTDFHQGEAPKNSLLLDANGDFVYALDDNGGAGVTYFAMTIGGRQNGPTSITV